MKFQPSVQPDNQNTIQRAAVYIPGKDGPLNGISDKSDLGVRSFTKKQREQIFNNVASVGSMKVPHVGTVNMYPNQGSAGGKVIRPKYARHLEGQIDHIVPEDKGGGNTNKNAQILDGHSNGTKKNTYPSTFSSHEGGTRVYKKGGIPGMFGEIFKASTSNGGEIMLPSKLITPITVTIAGPIYLGEKLNGPYTTQYNILAKSPTQVASLGGKVTAIPAGTILKKGESIPSGSTIPFGTPIPGGSEIPNQSIISLTCAQALNMAPNYPVPD